MLVQLAIIPFGAKGESPTRRCGMDGYNPPELPWGPAAAAADVAQGLRQKREQRWRWLEQRGGSAQEAELAQSLEQQAEQRSAEVEGWAAGAPPYPPPPPAPPNFWACQGAMAQACSYAAYFRTKDEPPAQQQACLQCATNPQVIPTPSHLLDRISPIFAPFFLVFCAFSPSRRGGSNEPKTGIQGHETVSRAPKHRLAV